MCVLNKPVCDCHGLTIISSHSQCCLWFSQLNSCMSDLVEKNAATNSTNFIWRFAFNWKKPKATGFRNVVFFRCQCAPSILHQGRDLYSKMWKLKIRSFLCGNHFTIWKMDMFWSTGPASPWNSLLAPPPRHWLRHQTTVPRVFGHQPFSRQATRPHWWAVVVKIWMSLMPRFCKPAGEEGTPEAQFRQPLFLAN